MEDQSKTLVNAQSNNGQRLFTTLFHQAPQELDTDMLLQEMLVKKIVFYHQCLKVPVATKEPLELPTASKKDAQLKHSQKPVEFQELKDPVQFQLFSTDNVMHVIMDVLHLDIADYLILIVTKCLLLDFVIKCVNQLMEAAHQDIYSLNLPEEFLVKYQMRRNNLSKMMMTLKT